MQRLYWDCQMFKRREPNKFQSLGNQFINGLQINITEIQNLFSKYQFAQSITFLIDISCQSKIVNAQYLYNSVEKLKNYVDQYMEWIEGILQTKPNFQLDQQKQAASLFIDIIQIARSTINDWYEFNHLPQQKDLFQKEINSIEIIFHIQPTREDCQCQIF